MRASTFPISVGSRSSNFPKSSSIRILLVEDDLGGVLCIIERCFAEAELDVSSKTLSVRLALAEHILVRVELGVAHSVVSGEVDAVTTINAFYDEAGCGELLFD